MLAFEGMMNAQRNRGMYLRVGESRAEIRKSRKISQAKLAKLLGVVEGTVQNCEHGRNEPNITRLYDAKRGRQPRVEYYAFKKCMSHADECVRLAGLTDDLIVRDQLLDLAQEWMLAARRARRPRDDTRVVSLHKTLGDNVVPLHTNQDDDS
jgi:DNA-binding XRE family transcriptional regulator